MRALLVAAALSCATNPPRERVAAAAPGEPCGGAVDLDQLCETAREPVTVGPNPLDAPVVDANTTYEVAGFAANKRGYLVLEAQDTGAYTLYFGGPPVSARLGDELPTCTGPAAGCMRSAATYVLAAGERYEIELGPISSGQRVLLHIHAPASDEHVVRAGPHRDGDSTRGGASSTSPTSATPTSSVCTCAMSTAVRPTTTPCVLAGRSSTSRMSLAVGATRRPTSW